MSQAKTKKKEFLEQMDRIIPWGEWIGIIKLHYYSGERGNKPFELYPVQSYLMKVSGKYCIAPRTKAMYRLTNHIQFVML